jgi:hypothetical protein
VKEIDEISINGSNLATVGRKKEPSSTMPSTKRSIVRRSGIVSPDSFARISFRMFTRGNTLLGACTHNTQGKLNWMYNTKEIQAFRNHIIKLFN